MLDRAVLLFAPLLFPAFLGLSLWEQGGPARPAPAASAVRSEAPWPVPEGAPVSVRLVRRSALPLPGPRGTDGAGIKRKAECAGKVKRARPASTAVSAT